MPFVLAVLMSLVQKPAVIPPPDQKMVWMTALHECENPHNIPKILDSNNRYSYGRYEWQMRSWLNYKAQGATKNNILNDAMQDKITRYVLDNGGERNWKICSKKVETKLGTY